MSHHHPPSPITQARRDLHLPPTDPPTTDPDTSPPDRSDEATLVSFFAAQAQTLCGALRLPTKVAASALYYLHRFFARSSVLEADPKDVMLAAVYVAAKAEECYVSAERVAAAAGMPAAAVLRREPALLQGVGFDLLVWLPHRALEGLWTMLVAARSEKDASETLGDALASAPADTLDAARAASHRAVAVLLLSDAPLLAPPGQLALAALRSGLKKVGLPLGSFATVLTARAVADAAATGAASAADISAAALEADIMGGLAALDALAAGAVEPPCSDAARAADARVRRARAPLVDAAKAAAADRDAGDAEARAVKAAAKRAAAAAREVQLLGPPPPPVDGGGGKRRKSEVGPVAGGE